MSNNPNELASVGWTNSLVEFAFVAASATCISSRDFALPKCVSPVPVISA